jgi:hypothetical protein
MPSLEARLAKLEERAPDGNPLLTKILRALPPLNENGELDWAAGNELQRGLQEVLREFGIGSRQAGTAHSRFHGLDPLDSALAWVVDHLHRDTGERNPLAIERFRGRVPDRVLAALYSRMRNFAFAADIALQVRQLAGVLDVHGNPLPGYILLENGCIIDAPVAHRSATSWVS